MSGMCIWLGCDELGLIPRSLEPGDGLSDLHSVDTQDFLFQLHPDIWFLSRGKKMQHLGKSHGFVT